MVSMVSCQRATWPNLRYYPVNEEWQRQACNILGLEFIAISNYARDRGGPDTILTRPDFKNCYYLPHVIFPPLVGNGADGLPNCITLYSHPRRYNSVEEYILQTRMDHETVWGTNIEMACLAHMLNSPVYCYDASQCYHIWAVYFPNDVDRSIPKDVGQNLFIFILLIIIFK